MKLWKFRKRKISWIGHCVFTLPEWIKNRESCSCAKRPETICQILFRQKFHLPKVSLKIRLISERPEDLGGLIRESLILCMRTFQDLGLMVFDSIKSLCLTANTEAVLPEIYYKLGEVTALSILIIGRELECLQPAIVRFIFQVWKYWRRFYNLWPWRNFERDLWPAVWC